MFATQRLGQLLSETQDRQWALELLITQLYDPAFEVCEAAAQYLEIACENLQILETVVKERPILDHLGDVGQSLLMRYVTVNMPRGC
jgi:rapamycin-insensitive companion of mTOR